MFFELILKGDVENIIIFGERFFFLFFRMFFELILKGDVEKQIYIREDNWGDNFWMDIFYFIISEDNKIFLQPLFPNLYPITAYRGRSAAP